MVTMKSAAAREGPWNVPPALAFDVQSAMKDDCGRAADNNAGGNLPQRAGEDARQQSRRLHAERRPDTDLAAPPRDRKGPEGVRSRR
jgi:hypothetical protein